jgi:hypothetical protein
VDASQSAAATAVAKHTHSRALKGRLPGAIQAHLASPVPHEHAGSHGHHNFSTGTGTGFPA